MKQILDKTAPEHLESKLSYIAKCAGFELTQIKDATLLKSGLPHSGYNYIYKRTNHISETDLREFFKVFQEDNKLPFVWFSPYMEEETLQYMKKVGFSHDARLRIMYLDLTQAKIEEHNTHNVKLIRSDEEFEEWCNIFSQVWNREAINTKRFLHKVYYNDKERKIEFFLAYNKNNKPVGCSTMFHIDNIAGCYWGSVLKEHRREGVGSAMLAARQKLAKELNYKHFVAQCLNTSYNIFLNFGFEYCGDMHVMRFNPVK